MQTHFQLLHRREFPLLMNSYRDPRETMEVSAGCSTVKSKSVVRNRTTFTATHIWVLRAPAHRSRPGETDRSIIE